MTFVALDPPASAEAYQDVNGRVEFTPRLTGTGHKLYGHLR
jgi:hypothetical protein